MARIDAAAAPYLAILFWFGIEIEKAEFGFGESAPRLPIILESILELRFDLLDLWSL